MNKREILERVAKGELTIEEAEELLSNNKIEEVEELVKYDLLREKRTGIPEIIYSETKTPEVVVEITKKVLKKKSIVLLSRLTPKHIDKLKEMSSDYILEFGTGEKFCLVKTCNYQKQEPCGRIGIITAGTSDIPVAEEAKVVAEMMGCEVFMVNDVGVAGIHRL
ncbi:MAG: nickel pincer cofactor biosynthesis protein LarB, partial [Candidatus Heimdallarchaeaceae archaeon]